MTGLPVVSVIIPAYNRARLLPETVASVFAQTFNDWELIIADDGSVDGTREYLRSLRDPRVRVVELNHTGNTATVRNVAVAHVLGKWIAFLDSDDLWLPSKLHAQLAALNANPQCGWSCTGFSFIDAAGTPAAQRDGPPYVPRSGWILEPLLTFDATATIQSVMVRRTLFDAVGGFDEASPVTPDYDLELRLAARSELCALAERLTIVRHHEQRTTSLSRSADLFENNARIFRKAGAAATSRTIRAICARQRATQLAWKARALAREREHRASFIAIARAMRVAPFQRDVWRALAGCTLRALGR